MLVAIPALPAQILALSLLYPLYPLICWLHPPVYPLYPLIYPIYTYVPTVPAKIPNLLAHIPLIYLIYAHILPLYHKKTANRLLWSGLRPNLAKPFPNWHH